MKNICTVSDKNYLIQGLSLYQSLDDNTKDFKLHYLCIDDYTKIKLDKLNLKNLKTYSVKEFLNSDPTLNKLFYSEYKYFCWSLASYFSNFLLKKYDSILYIDSDIYFYENLDLLYDEIGNKDVAIFKHRQFKYEDNRPEGAYNVGVVYFKNSLRGVEVSNWWVDAVINKKYPQLSTCGDQKYLDNFQHMCSESEIMIDGDYGHGAPWQWQLYDYSEFLETGNIIWNGKKQKLLFSHFSQFDPCFKEDSYVASKQHQIYTPTIMYSNNPSLKKIYDDYFNINKKQKKFLDGY